MTKQSFTPIGTYMPVPLDGVRETLVVDGTFVDRRNGTTMEMDAYGAYLALKAMPDGDPDNLATRRFIVERIEARRIACGGFWWHGVWSPETREVHLRFTAAALRLLIEAHVDGLYPDSRQLIATLRHHLAYQEALTIGPWFLHDTLELPETAAHALEKPRPNAVWGSSPGNCLVLNTHIDTLLTLIDALDRVDMPAIDRAELTALADAALGTLETVLAAPPRRWWWPLFSAIDTQARGFLLRNRNPKSRIVNIIKWRMVIYRYYKWRRAVKARLPRFDFDDGYLERDIGLLGYFFDYHVYNLHDLLRLVRVADRGNRIAPSFRAHILAVVDKAIDYACREPFASFVRDGFEENGRAAVLAEAILARKTLTPGFVTPEPWRRMAELIAASVAPSPAMLGYDPFILPDAGAGTRDAAPLAMGLAG